MDNDFLFIKNVSDRLNDVYEIVKEEFKDHTNFIVEKRREKSFTTSIIVNDGDCRYAGNRVKFVIFPQPNLMDSHYRIEVFYLFDNGYILKKKNKYIVYKDSIRKILHEFARGNYELKGL